MDYQNFNYKNIFLGACLGGVICTNVISPIIVLDDEEEEKKIIKIPSEFSGLYLTNTSSGSSYVSAIAFPIIPSFS